MKIHNAQQGSEEWIALRRSHFNASEAAAMLGLDKKMTRTALLELKSFGNEKEYTSWVRENILEKGHVFEDSARSILESEIGEDLFRVVGSEGKLLASFDGLTMDESVIYEHKQWNKELAECVAAGSVPDTHMPQLQQQLMISESEKAIFIVSDGTAENRVKIEVYPSKEWQDRIIAGWNQFDKDLAAFTPTEKVEPVQAEEMMALPALYIQTSGEISIQSNLELFGVKLKEFVDSLDLAPNDDQGFANAEAAVKLLQKAEASLDAAEAAALGQTASMDEMRRAVALNADLARKTRLLLEKVVKNRKEQLKSEIILSVRSAYQQHIASLEKEIAPIRIMIPAPDFIGATKGLRTIATLKNAADTALANAKIDADAAAKDIREKLSWFSLSAAGLIRLFPDLQQIISKSEEDFKLLVNSRIDEHEKAEEERIRAVKDSANQESAPVSQSIKIIEFIPPETKAPAFGKSFSSGGSITTLHANESQESSLKYKINVVDIHLLCREIVNGTAPINLVAPDFLRIARWVSENSIKEFPGLDIQINNSSHTQNTDLFGSEQKTKSRKLNKKDENKYEGK